MKADITSTARLSYKVTFTADQGQQLTEQLLRVA